MNQVYKIKEAVAGLTAGAFFLKLLHSITNTHIHHLQADTLSKHLALGEYYSEVEDLVDSLIETYQGTKGIVQYPNTYEPPFDSGLTELKILNDFVIANRTVIGTESNLQNEVDGILSLIQTTIYKLERLK